MLRELVHEAQAEAFERAAQQFELVELCSPLETAHLQARMGAQYLRALATAPALAEPVLIGKKFTPGQLLKPSEDEAITAPTSDAPPNSQPKGEDR